MKGSHVGQAWLPLCESMLATPNHLVWKLFLQGRNESEWLVVPCMFLLGDRGDICFLPVLTQPFTNNGGRTGSDMGHLPQHLLAVSHQVPGTCVRPGCLGDPLPSPPPTRVSLPCSRLFLRSQQSGIPVTKTYQWISRWKTHWEPHYLPCVLSAGPLHHFCNKSTYSMVFLFMLNYLQTPFL